MTPAADSEDTTSEMASFRADHPDGQRVLEAVLAVDSELETWTFDDIEIDSGAFGELVSRGIVEKVDGEYQLADPADLRAILNGAPGADSDDDSTDGLTRGLSLPSVDWRAMTGLVVALCVVAGARMTAFASVFQRGYVILPGNDPYYYRYWLRELLADSLGVTDFSVLVDPPNGVSIKRPFSHVTNWFVAELLGGGEWAAETVAIWLPVVGSVLLGAMLYKLAVLLTRDVRVGIASVLVLAVTPVHAVYTGLGYLDHNVHQYFWLGVTLLTLGWLAVDLQRHVDRTDETQTAVRSHLRAAPTWGVAAVFGLSVAAGTHTWGGSPLLLLPLAGYIGLRVALDARADVSPLRASLPVLGGLAFGSVVSLILHLRWGWHSRFVASTPLLVFGGAVVVTLLAELWRGRSLRYSGLLLSEAALAMSGIVLLRWLRPQEVTSALTRVGDLFVREGAIETASLFSTEYAVLGGPLYQLGMVFYIAVAVLGWICVVVTRRYEPGWLLLGTYSGFLLITAGIQARFAGQLAVPFSILGGVGIVYLLSAVDLARRPALFDPSTEPTAGDGSAPDLSIAMPDRDRAVYLLGIGVLIFGISLVFVPGLTAQTSYSGPQVAALAAIDDHATENDREFPANYVLSEWGDNRMYNYFVNGGSRSYQYAFNNYNSFRSGTDPTGWYDRFNGRVGYVVVSAVEPDVSPETIQYQLLEDLGAGGAGQEAVSHYQLLSVDDERTAAAFAIVSGATIEGSGEPGETVAVSTEVTVDETTFTYQREVTVGNNGRFTVVVPYAGTYRVGPDRIEVAETDVKDGLTVRTAN